MNLKKAFSLVEIIVSFFYLTFSFNTNNKIKFTNLGNL